MIDILKIFKLRELSFLLLFFNELLNLSKKKFFVVFTHLKSEFLKRVFFGFLKQDFSGSFGQVFNEFTFFQTFGSLFLVDHWVKVFIYYLVFFFFLGVSRPIQIVGSKGFSLVGSRHLVLELRLQIRSSIFIIIFFFLHFSIVYRYFGTIHFQIIV